MLPTTILKMAQKCWQKSKKIKALADELQAQEYGDEDDEEPKLEE